MRISREQVAMESTLSRLVSARVLEGPYAFSSHERAEGEPGFVWHDRTIAGVRESVGDFHAEAFYGPAKWYQVPLCGAGDYVGEALTEANRREFLRLFGTLPGVVQTYGYPGFNGIAVRRALLRNEEVRECLGGLIGYPVVGDEGALWEVESEREQAAWESVYAPDVRKLICADDDSPCDECETCLMSNDDLLALTRDAMERENVQWHHETGDSVYLDIDRIFPDAADRRDAAKAKRDAETAARVRVDRNDVAIASQWYHVDRYGYVLEAGIGRRYA